MRRQLADFKRRRLEESKDQPVVLLTNGCRVKGLEPGQLRAVQRELTFQPPVVFDTGGPSPPPVLAYRIEEAGSIIVPRCYGVSHFGATCEQLSNGEPLGADAASFGGNLLPRQVPAFTASIAALSSPPHAGILVLPCGFGKTVVSIAVAARMGRRTMVVVHKEFLLEQWRERLRHFLPGATIGVVQGPRCEIDRDFIIAMVQSLASRDYGDRTFSCVGTVIIDESHHMAARLFSEIFFRLSARHVLGLTATPKRKDGCTSVLHLHMGAFAHQEEDVINHATVLRVLYVSPWLSRKDEDLTPPEAQRLKTRLTRDANRNRLIMDWIVRSTDGGRRVLVLSDRVAHLEDLLSSFSSLRAHVSCSLYVGGMKRAAREDASKCTALFGTFSMAQEGLDIPELDTLILATPASDVTQAVGRILRSLPDKASPLVIDIQDDCCRNFTRLNEVRASLYKRRGFEARAPGEKDPPP